MEPVQQVTVTRTVSLDASADEVWQLLTDAEELSRWFAGSATIDVVPGGVGRFVDGESVRRAVVHHVEPGRRLGFTWWDEGRPAEASTVELTIDDSTIDGRLQLTITETLVASGGIGARACSWFDAAESWEGRLCALADSLVGRCSPLVR